jgi:hypothetical protein
VAHSAYKNNQLWEKSNNGCMTVLSSCCDTDLTPLIELRIAKTKGKPFKLRHGAMDEFDMIVMAQHS